MVFVENVLLRSEVLFATMTFFFFLPPEVILVFIGL